MGLASRLYYLEKQVKELTNSLKKTAGSSPQDAAMSDAGMNTDLAVGGMGEFLGKIFMARVVNSVDTLHGGHLNVICDQVHGEEEFTCKMATPFGGAGYGFFGVPGRGASVLITEVTGEGWVWFACVYNLEVEKGGVATVVDPKGEGSEAQKHEAEDELAKLGRKEGDPMQMTHGVPESFLVYEDNNQPEQYIWKTPKGNKIIMSEKHTENSEEKHITIQSVGGKRIILDDGDARTTIGTEPTIPEGQTGDRIIIADGDEWEEEGGPNRIWIQSTAGEAGVEDSIQVYARNSLFLEAREGNINMTVLDSEVEDAHILITNLASGNLEMDIEEGDIAAAAKYRICLNAWSEDESEPHLGTIGMRSKGSFSVKNGFEGETQNLQMHHETKTMAVNAGTQALVLMGGSDTPTAHLMGKTVYVTAEDLIHLDANRIILNANSIDLNYGNQIVNRTFNDAFNLPMLDGLAPCELLEDDKEIEFLSNNSGAGGGASLAGMGGLGGGGENLTQDPDTGGDTADPPPPGGTPGEVGFGLKGEDGGTGTGGGSGGGGSGGSGGTPPPPPSGGTPPPPPPGPSTPTTPSTPGATPPPPPPGTPTTPPGGGTAPPPGAPTTPPTPPTPPTIALPPTPTTPRGPIIPSPLGVPGLLDDEEVDDISYGDEDHGDPGTPPPPPGGGTNDPTVVITQIDVPDDGGLGKDDRGKIHPPGRRPPGQDGVISPRVSWFQQTRRVGQPGVDETEETHGTPSKGDSLTYPTSLKAPSTGKPGSEGHPGTSQTEGLGSTTSEREPPTGGGVDYYGL